MFPPVLTFQQLFEEEGVPITAEEVIHKTENFIKFDLVHKWIIHGRKHQCKIATNIHMRIQEDSGAGPKQEDSHGQLTIDNLLSINNYYSQFTNQYSQFKIQN